MYSSFLGAQVNQAQTTASSLEAFATQLAQINNMLADPNSGLSPAMLDFFGQERPDFLCLRLVAHGPADWFERIYTMKSCRTAQQILDSALDAEGGGAMV